MHKRQNGVRSIVVVSTRSNVPGFYAKWMPLVKSFPPVGESTSDDALDWQWTSCGGELLFDDAELEYRRLSGGGDLLSTIITYHFLWLALPWVPRCSGGSAFMASSVQSHLPCSSTSDSAQCVRSTEEARWYTAHQRWWVSQIRWASPFTGRASWDSSSQTDVQLSGSFHSCFAYSAGFINLFLMLGKSQLSFGILACVTSRLRRNWTIADFYFNKHSW